MKAASAASLTGMTGSRTLAKIGCARVGRWAFTRSMSNLHTVRITTRARRRVSTGLPGFMSCASSSMIDLVASNPFGDSVRRYLPAASTKLSAMKV